VSPPRGAGPIGQRPFWKKGLVWAGAPVLPKSSLILVFIAFPLLGKSINILFDPRPLPEMGRDPSALFLPPAETGPP